MDVLLGYARLSSQKQANESDSLERHVARLKAAGVPDENIYQEIQSGTDPTRTLFNEVLDRACELAEQGHQVKLFVANLNRWARDVKASVETIDRADDAGVIIWHLDGHRQISFDGDGFLINMMEALYADWYSRNISTQVRGVNASKRKEGKPLSGRAPYGYKRGSEGKYEIDSETLAICRATIEYLLAGHSIRQTRTHIEETTGKFWDNRTLHYWLRNPVVRGHLRYSKGGLTQKEIRRGVKRKDKDPELAYNTHDAIMAESEWERIQLILDNNRRKAGQTGDSAERFATVGKYVKCGHCGGKCTARSSRGYRSFYCNRTDCSRAGTRDNLVEDAIKKALANKAADLASAVVTPTKAKKSIQELELESQLQIYQAAFDDTGRGEGVIREIETELATVRAKSQSLVDNLPELEPWLEHLKDPAFFDYMPIKDRRLAFLELIRRVSIKDGEVKSVETVWD